MPAEPIRFYHSTTGSLETETVYGENYLQWTYGSPLGRLSLDLLVKRRIFSAWYGWRMDRPASRSKILPFIAQYGLDPDEFAEPPENFHTFNEFFYRRLKPSARLIATDPNTLVFPADGRHFGFPDLSEAAEFYVKGQRFDLARFLQDDALTKRYEGGTMVFSRLCPVDYHRFHFPVDGTPGPLRLINGALYSVNPIALRKRLAYLWENKRAIARIPTQEFGEVLACPIGATCVGGIVPTYEADTPIERGQEMGYFKFGGSSIILLFEPDAVRLNADLVEWTRKGIEVYAQMGQPLGTLN